MHKKSFEWLRLMVGTFVIATIIGGSPAHAADAVKTFDIPSETAAAALNEFARQADITLAFSYDVVSSEHTQAVKGDFTIPDALGQMLKGTKLGFKSVSDKTIAIDLATRINNGSGAVAQKGVDGSVHFDIRVQDLDAALKDFSTQSAIAVVAAANLTTGKKGKKVSGTMPAAEALRRLLKGSGLSFTLDSDGRYAIQANSSEGPNQEKADTADVTVEGQQQKEKPYSGMNVDIPRTIDDVQPYYIFDSATIEQSGAENIEDFLKQRLTMNTTYRTASQTYGSPTGVAGATTSSINLRGLGTNETLILVDGRRMAGVTFNGSTSQPDINGIPLAAIDRIEVLPSSASGIYGGSAVGGVVNIILKRNYQGGDARISYDKPGHSSASTAGIDGAYGFSLEDGKTHVMLSGHYSDATPLDLGDRASLVLRGINTIQNNCPNCFYNAYNAYPGGSTPNILGLDGNFNPSPIILGNGKNTGLTYAHIAPGCSSTSPLASCLLPGYSFGLSPGYGTYGLAQPLGSFATVTSFDATVNRQMTSWLNVFADVRTEENLGRTQSTPLGGNNVYSPTVPGGGPFQNPYIVYNLPPTYTAPARADSATHTATAGMTFAFPAGWNGEADYTWSKNELSAINEQVNITSFLNDVSSGAFDPFVDSTTFPPNYSAYQRAQTWDSSTVTQDVALRGTGPVASLPAGAVTLAFGLDYDWDRVPLEEQVNPVFVNGSTNPNFYYLPQSQSIASLYMEGTVPVVTTKNAVWGIRDLEFQVSDRIERYSTLAGTNSEAVLQTTSGSAGTIYYSPTPANANMDGSGGTPSRFGTSYHSNNETVGLKYKPIDDLTFRVSRATAFLPPNYSQLFPNPVQLCSQCDSITDPKTGQTYPVNVINGGGGNPDIKPQSSRSWNLGWIYEPQEDALKGLRIDVEYYDIAQFNYITPPTGNEILGNPAFADRVTRNATGVVTQIDESLINAPLFRTEGWDLSVDYRRPTPIGIFAWHLAATRIDIENRQFSIGGPIGDYVGWSDEGGEDRYKANGTLTWAAYQWTLGWTTLWYGSYAVNGTAGDPATGLDSGPDALAIQQGSKRIPSQMYHQLLINYSFGKENQALGGAFSNLSLQLVIKNLFNTLPPFDADQAPFYYSPYGDINLRTFDLAFKKSF